MGENKQTMLKNLNERLPFDQRSSKFSISARNILNQRLPSEQDKATSYLGAMKANGGFWKAHQILNNKY